MARMINFRTPEQIEASIKDSLRRSSKLTSLDSRSDAGAMIKAFANELGQFYKAVNASLDQGYTRTASGQFLDIKANDRGMQRQAFFVTDVDCETETFRIKLANGEPIYSVLTNPAEPFKIIEKGIAITSTRFPGVRFVTNKIVSFGPDDRIINIGASASIEENSTISAGSFDTMSFSSIAHFSGADLSQMIFEQTKDIFSTEIFETDESLRLRVQRKALEDLAGNETALSSLAFSHPQVKNIVFKTFVRGTGSLDIILIPTRTKVPASVVEEIRQAIQPLVSRGEDVLVKGPDIIPVSMRILLTNLNSSSQGLVRSSIERLIQEIPNGGSLSQKDVKSRLAGDGFSTAVIQSLSVNGQQLIPGQAFTLFQDEIFNLVSPNLGANSIDVVIGS